MPPLPLIWFIPTVWLTHIFKPLLSAPPRHPDPFLSSICLLALHLGIWMDACSLRQPSTQSSWQQHPAWTLGSHPFFPTFSVHVV